MPQHHPGFWDKGATNGVALPTPVAFTDPFWSAAPYNVTYPVTNRIPVALGDDGTVIGYDTMGTGGTQFPFFYAHGLQQTWRWTSTMAQVQLLADLDQIDLVQSTNDSGWGEFSTRPVSITSVNGVETIYAYHQHYGFNTVFTSSPPVSTTFFKSYTEVYSSSNSYQPTLYYAADRTDEEVGAPPINQNYTYTYMSSHESRLPFQDNGSGTVISRSLYLNAMVRYMRLSLIAALAVLFVDPAVADTIEPVDQGKSPDCQMQVVNIRDGGGGYFELRTSAGDVHFSEKTISDHYAVPPKAAQQVLWSLDSQWVAIAFGTTKFSVETIVLHRKWHHLRISGPPSLRC